MNSQRSACLSVPQLRRHSPPPASKAFHLTLSPLLHHPIDSAHRPLDPCLGLAFSFCSFHIYPSGALFLESCLKALVVTSQKVHTGSIPKGHLVCKVLLQLSQADISAVLASPCFSPWSLTKVCPQYSQILSPGLFDSVFLSCLSHTPLLLLYQSLSALRNLELGFRPCLIAASGEREAE